MILGGSDPRAGKVPRGLDPEDMLTGYKGIQPVATGHCLAGELVQRVKESRQFKGPILVGPRRIYDGNVDCEIIDVEGNLVKILQRAFEVIGERFNFASPVAFSTCDILPTPDEFRQLLQTCYAPYQDCMFWWQMVEAMPEELGASAWKPSYRIRPGPTQPPKNLYPGHLVIVRPHALRINLTNRILELMYRYRNCEIQRRHLRMIARGLGALVAEDFHELFSFKLPLLTVSIPYYGLSRCTQLRQGILTMADFESGAAKAFLHRDFHQAAGGRPVVFATTRILSFAKDVDTKAELAEVA